MSRSSLVSDIKFELKISLFENIKALSLLFHLLSKIGKDLLVEIEPEQNKIFLRAISDAKSAFAEVSFGSTFFEYVRGGREPFSCKLSLKALCSMMKNIRNVQTLVMRAQIVDSEHELVIEMKLSSGIKRSYRFLFSDCEIIGVTFDDVTASQIKADPKIFSQLLEHIHMSQEISMVVSSDIFKARSFHTNDDVLSNTQSNTSTQISDAMKRALSTGVNIDISEFDVYDYKSQGLRSEGSSSRQRTNANQSASKDEEELIFCIKEFRAMLGFCEAQDLSDFQLLFSSTGRPVKLTCRQRSFEVNIIMATLYPHIRENEAEFDEPLPVAQPNPQANRSVNSGTVGRGKEKDTPTSGLKRVQWQGGEGDEGKEEGRDASEEETTIPVDASLVSVGVRASVSVHPSVSFDFSTHIADSPGAASNALFVQQKQQEQHNRTTTFNSTITSSQEDIAQTILTLQSSFANHNSSINAAGNNDDDDPADEPIVPAGSAKKKRLARKKLNYFSSSDEDN